MSALAAHRMSLLSSGRQIKVDALVEKLWQDDDKGRSILADLFVASVERRPNEAAIGREVIQALRAGDEPKVMALLYAAIDDAHTDTALEEVEDEQCEAILRERDCDPTHFPRPAASQLPPAAMQSGASHLTHYAGTDNSKVAGGAFPHSEAA